MKVSIVSPAECSELAVKTLGLDATVVDLLSTEGMAASLRRAASFMCPASPKQLVDAVLEAMQPLNPEHGPSRDDLGEIVDLLISTGDLLELKQQSDRVTRLLYLGPPSCIEKEPGRYLVVGVRPFGAPLVSPGVAPSVEYEGHTRTIGLEPEQAEARLRALGLHVVSRDRWIARPARSGATDLVTALQQRLNFAGPAGDVEGLLILDPAARVSFYRGRWRPPKASDTGDFVARRPQAYGADLWCYVRLADGAPQRLIDLPVEDTGTPGRDEAWRLQAAIDALRGQPQQFRTSRANNTSGDITVDLFSPVPGWTERYLELVGMSIARSRGALFSYRVPVGATPALSDLLTDMLWMCPPPEGGTE